METRSLPTPPRSDGRRLTGYAARFNSPSRIIAERGKVFREVILPGSFARSLAAPHRGSIVALWQHGQDGRPPLGRTPTTLRLIEDANGLAFELDLPESAADVAEAVRRGDVWGMSFGMLTHTPKVRWSVRDGLPFREISDLDLLEISLVIEPAYSATSVEARGLSTVAVPDLPRPSIDRARKLLKLADRAGG